MPEGSPPSGARAEPRFTEIPAGSFLWRVGRAGQESRVGLNSVFREFDHARFDPRLAGRFDPTPESRFSYCYAAFDDLTAICEVLLRDLTWTSRHRYVPAAAIRNSQLMILETLTPLWLVSLLSAADLAAVRQDSWLVHAESPKSYELTREWARWLRDSVAPDGKAPAGLLWQSKREPAGRAVLLFGDRCADSVVRSPFGIRPLDSGEGRTWLNRRLALLRTKVDDKKPPRLWQSSPIWPGSPMDRPGRGGAPWNSS
jgi:hypothetical protein